MDIHNYMLAIMDIHKSIMDIHNYMLAIVDIHNPIMDIHIITGFMRFWLSIH